MSEQDFSTVQLPERVSELADACGFKVTGWEEAGDDTDVIITGKDVNYMGSREEVVAFMTAWQQCHDSKFPTTPPAPPDPNQVSIGLMSWSSTGNINPSDITQVWCRPQVGAFRGRRIIIPDDIAPNFTIEDIRVGNRSQLLQSGSIPGQAFAARIPESLSTFLAQVRGNQVIRMTIDKPALAEFGRAISMDTCQTAMDMIIVIRNSTSMPRPFRAWVVGPYVVR